MAEFTSKVNSAIRSWFNRKILEFKKEWRTQYKDVKPSRIALNMALVIIGTILLSFNTSIFMVPASIISGGNSGIALVIEAVVKLCGGSLDAIGGINTLITILTVFFFILGLLIVGFDFTLKTGISTVVYPIFVWVFDAIRDAPGMEWMRLENYFVGESLEATGGAAAQGNAGVVLVAGLIGGVILGLGVALAFKGGGSTGGTDCLIIAISNHTRLKANTVSIIIDASIVIIGICVVQDLVSGAVSILSAIICSVMIKTLFVGSQSMYKAEIISSRWKEISDAINRDMGRGTTIYPAKGGYTGADRYVVSVSFTREEYNDLVKLIQGTDASAFVTVSSVSEVRGYGFSYDDDESIKQIPEKGKRKIADSFKRAEKEARKADQAKAKDIKKDVDRVIKQEKRERREERKGENKQ